MWPKNTAGRWNNSAIAPEKPMFWRKAAVLAFALAVAAQANDLRLVDAVKAGDRVTVGTLLKNHADVNAAEPDGTTALQWAVHADDLEMTQLLLRAGANGSRANRYGVTPLSLAATNRNAAIVRALLD